MRDTYFVKHTYYSCTYETGWHTLIGSDSGKVPSLLFLRYQHRRLCRFYTLQNSCVQWSGTLNGALYLHIKECWAISWILLSCIVVFSAVLWWTQRSKMQVYSLDILFRGPIQHFKTVLMMLRMVKILLTYLK